MFDFEFYLDTGYILLIFYKQLIGDIYEKKIMN